MKLLFDREVVIINGLPIVGTVEVEVEGELDRTHGLYHGSWVLEAEVVSFEPEDGGKEPLWSTAKAPCEDWLAANKLRVERLALENAAP